ncbi:aminotransferase class V-fold PLP-dependent enzyme [Massilia sp. W12]|uniref:aminotransferase class V-fold PLP-dependent enzyme n=1 Tax=Massilia sp. W12 TaxID=3126507 RepID=UPI0030CA7C1C
MTHEFAASNGIYLLHHSVGRPWADAASHFQQRFFAPWADGAGDPWGEWITVFDDFRAALAQLLNSAPQQFCAQTNLSSAFGKILQALPIDPKRGVILLSESDFPSMGFVAQQAQRMGYRLRFLPATLDQSEAQVWLDAMREDVQWLLLTQVQSNTGIQVPLAPVLAAARARGILSVVDAAQGVGILPIDLQALQPDFFLASCVKWLCSGPGAGFLWAHADILPRCQPADVGWFSHANPFAFDIHDFAYHPDARRFWGGTPSVAPFVLAAHSIRRLHAVGVAQIRAYNLAQSRRIIEALPPGCLVSPAEDARRSGTLIVHYGARQQALVQALQAAQIRCDSRAFGVRLSTHISNPPEEIDQLLQVLQTLA